MNILRTTNIIEFRLGYLASIQGNKTALQFVDGESWTWQELLTRVREHAVGLQSQGVNQSDFVLSWVPNGPIAVLNFLALNYLGAIYVPINTSYKGILLEHVINNSGASIMIAHGALTARLESINLSKLDKLVIIGDERPDLPTIEHIGFENLQTHNSSLRAKSKPIAPSDIQMVVYTSGTTGPSKGVLSSYAHGYAAALGFRNIGSEDCILVAMPMFHVGGIYGILWALYHGATVVMAESFKTKQFWPLVAKYKITTTGLLGSMVDFLNTLPTTAHDKTHSLKSVIIAPYTPSAITFEKRFSVDVYTEYNMTELSVPLFIGPNPGVPGTCGKVSAGFELRLVNENDIEVPEGSSGQLILRTSEPWQLSHGYHNDPVATANAWRNGWFHTGDIFRRNPDGHYFFVDRAKDALRRRGENISSFEVESAILLHPGVSEVAVIAVPADDGIEDEVLAVIVASLEHSVNPVELLPFLEKHLAHFMIPRYVRLVQTFPRTPTQKIEKHKLRAEGITSDTWDRQQAGISIKRDKLEQRN